MLAFLRLCKGFVNNFLCDLAHPSPLALLSIFPLDILPYFRDYRNMRRRPDPLLVTRSADRFSALGAEPRLQIMRALLAAHPGGMIAGEVQDELDIPASTLSHHLEKLKQVGLVNVKREGTFLWYSASTDALREVLGFLYEECCTRSSAVAPEEIVQISR